jgi:ADP-ribose pyrophosphatase YjhB (NUDIX family)
MHKDRKTPDRETQDQETSYLRDRQGGLNVMSRLWHFIQNVLGILFRHPVTGTSIIPVLPDGRIVLIRRRDNGRWGFPGGMVDWGEDIPSTVRRETAEETGLHVVKIGRLVGIYSSPERDGRLHSICVVVEAEVEGTLQVLDKNEVVDIQAFSREELPTSGLTHDHDRQLQDYLQGQTTLA